MKGYQCIGRIPRFFKSMYGIPLGGNMLSFPDPEKNKEKKRKEISRNGVYSCV